MYRKLLFLTIAVMAVTASFAKHDNGLKYTKENPLIYEDVWELPPFSFINEDGVPDGFNIELMKMMFEKLGVPYVIKLKHPPLNFQDVSSGDAALTIGMKAPFHNKYGRYGNSTIVLFTHSIATPKSKPVQVRDFDDLRNMKVYVHRNSFSHNQMIDAGLEENAIAMEDVKSLLIQVAEQDSGAILWNTSTLKELIRQNNITSLRLTPVSMAYGEYHFMSRDSLLLHKLDSLYDEMTLNDEILPIRQKWLFPKSDYETPTDFVGITTLVFSIFFIIMVFYNIYYRLQRHRMRKEDTKQARRLALLLKSGNIDLWTYNTEAKTFRIIDPEGKRSEEYAPKMFSLYFTPDDMEWITEEIDDIMRGTRKEAHMIVKSNLSRKSQEDRMTYSDLKISILEEKAGKPVVLIGVMKDVTKERAQFIDTRANLLKYRSVFNSSMSDLAYYDKDGYLTDINQSACETFGIKDRNALINSKTHITDIPVFSALEGDVFRELYTASITDMDKLHIEKESTLQWTRTGTIYYEFVITPIYDSKGQLICILSGGKDVTDMAKRMNKDRLRQSRIEKTSQLVQEHMDNINYALEVSGTRLGNYYPKAHEMTISQNLTKPMLKLSQLRCTTLIDEENKSKVGRLLIALDKKVVRNFALRVGTVFKDKFKNDAYYDFNGIPIIRGGKIDHYFYICRNVSKIVEMERQLNEETKRAQEAEKFQNSFLKNMSHEIRTPLYTVLGFAGLFQTEHDPEDEVVFIDQIKQNTDTLLKLVNNILLLSRIDANMVEVNTAPVDFPEFFKAKCLMGWTQGTAAGVETKIETPDKHLILDIDDSHIGLIIETFCRLAGHSTEKGYIHTRYSYHSGQLTMMFKDTGAGMDEKTKEQIRNRDLNSDTGDYGTLIQIVICKQLAALMGGTMDCDCKKGKGSVIWATIPCKAVETEEPQAIDTPPSGDFRFDSDLLKNSDNLSEEEINSLIAGCDLFK